MKTLLTSLRAYAALTLLTGAAYPLLVWAFAQTFVAHQANGSLVRRGPAVVGSELIAQKTSAARYFHPRPSAADYATLPSGASSLPWSSAKLVEAVRSRGDPRSVPADLLTCSGSGLDPDISPEAAAFQLARVAAARGLEGPRRADLEALVARHTVGGTLTPARVNVLALNLALDIQFPLP